MEALYAKLYKKYTNLKKEKETQLDELNREQEVKFMNYADAADEMIRYLKSENDRLHEEVGELKSQLTAIRLSCDEQRIHYQQLLKEESQKNEELSDEIARFQKLERNECSHCSMHQETVNEQENSRKDIPGGETPGKSVKKRKLLHMVEGTAAQSVDVEHDWAADQHVYKEKGVDPPPSIQQPACCQRKIYSPGGDATESSSVNCVFQHLVEFVVGMKVSPLTQSNELCILANHKSSGYSFSLTWISNSRGEIELLYRVVSLGTFERVAPEWMRETVIFSTNMCSVFFERVLRVIKS